MKTVHCTEKVPPQSFISVFCTACCTPNYTVKLMTGCFADTRISPASEACIASERLHAVCNGSSTAVHVKTRTHFSAHDSAWYNVTMAQLLVVHKTKLLTQRCLKWYLGFVIDIWVCVDPKSFWLFFGPKEGFSANFRKATMMQVRS